MGWKMRRDTTTNWAATSVDVEPGEQTLDTTTGLIRINRTTSNAAQTTLDDELKPIDQTTTAVQKGDGSGQLTDAVAGTDYYAPGGTDIPITDGGTGASSASAARTNLGLVIGTDVQAHDADLDTWATKTAPSGTVVGTIDTQTLTNKRVTKRVGTVASSATPTINTDDVDAFNITALAASITSMTTNLSGTPTDHQTLMIRVKDNGNARTITWGASFASSGVATLLASTSPGKTHAVGLEWDAAVSKWICLAVDATGF